MFQHSTSQYEDLLYLVILILIFEEGQNCTKVNNIVKHSNLTQLIKNHTRITDTSNTTLDLIFVTNPGKSFLLVFIILALVTIHNRKNKKVHLAPRTIKSRSFKNFNDKDFVDTVKNKDWMK